MAYQSIDPYAEEPVGTFASRIETGMVSINERSPSSPELPFGGVKNSGFGRELSDLGINEFVNKKLIRIASVAA